MFFLESLRKQYGAGRESDPPGEGNQLGHETKNWIKKRGAGSSLAGKANGVSGEMRKGTGTRKVN